MIDLSTLTNSDLGRPVIFTPRFGPPEYGTITSWSEEFIYVRYGTNPQGNATSPEDLEWNSSDPTISESTFTASSGHRCNYEVFVENGEASVNVVWIGQPPTAEDIREMQQAMQAQADQAGFPNSGAENILLGEIRREDLPRVRAIVAERVRAFDEDN